MIGSIFLSSMPAPINEVQNTLQIQCTTPRFTDLEFSKAERILTKRLEDFGINNFKFESNNSTGIIKIKMPLDVDQKVLEKLLTMKGQLAFYETIDRQRALNSMGSDDFLFKLMNIPVKKKQLGILGSQAILGYTKGDNRNAIEDYLKVKATEGKIFPGIKFAWGFSPLENSSYALFLLEEIPKLNNSFVTDASARKNDRASVDVLLSFNEDGAGLWKEMTGKSIGKSIAIVIDDQVYSAPKVNEAIANGKCMISGNFSEQEVAILVSLLGNEALPLDFELIK